MVFEQEFDESDAQHVLDVEFRIPRAGWIDCRVSPLHGMFEIWCTHIRDPFPGMLAWLEAIAGGSNSATWLIDQEGTCTRLQFYGGSPSLDDQADYIVELCSSGSLRKVRGMRVDRRQLVDSFYTAFRAMVGHPDYQPREWEGHPDYPSLDTVDDVEYAAAVSAFPYGGYDLRELHSPILEAFLAS